MISVVIPAYNAESYIAETLDSLLGQTCGDWEAIVVSDGSTDATDGIVREYAERDGRVRLIRQERSNAGVARNTGMDAATGDFLLFFDADDIMEPDMLARMLARGEEADADVVACRSTNFSEDGEDDGTRNGPWHVDMAIVYSGRDLGEHLFDSMIGWPWDKLYRAQFVRDAGLRFQSIGSTNDALFVFLSLAEAERIAFVDAPLVRHRRHSGSIATTRHVAPHNARIAYEAIAEAMEALDGLTPEMRGAYLRWGVGHMRWNFTTLEGEARAEAFKDYLDLMKQSLDHEGLALAPEDARARSALLQTDMSTEQLIAEQAIEVQRMQNEMNDLRAHVQGLQTVISDIHGSVAFKIGRAATKVPRMIRDAGKRG